MNGSYFTLEELEKLTLADLMRVADYLQIPYLKKIRKGDLVAKIMKLWETPEFTPTIALPESPKYSVRLQRIIERNGGRIP